jgi:hypothetical protein
MTTQLFDNRGRRIAPDGLVAKVGEPDSDYYAANPNSFRFLPRVQRLQNALGGLQFLPTDQLVARLSTLAQIIDADEALSSVFNGPCFPVSLPQLQFDDQGKLIDEVLLPGLGQIYQSVFDGRGWDNYRAGTLESEVSTVEPNYGRLLTELASGPRVGILALPLQGYSVDAQREQMPSLPQTACNISLMGPVDLIMAAATHPEEILRNGNTPGYDASAVNWRSAGGSLGLEAHGGGAYFDDEGDLGFAFGHCSGGLLFW